MILGALIDAGVKLEDVRQALGSLAITFRPPSCSNLENHPHARRHIILRKADMFSY